MSIKRVLAELQQKKRAKRGKATGSSRIAAGAENVGRSKPEKRKYTKKAKVLTTEDNMDIEGAGHDDVQAGGEEGEGGGEILLSPVIRKVGMFLSVDSLKELLTLFTAPEDALRGGMAVLQQQIEKGKEKQYKKARKTTAGKNDGSIVSVGTRGIEEGEGVVPEGGVDVHSFTTQKRLLCEQLERLQPALHTCLTNLWRLPSLLSQPDWLLTLKAAAAGDAPIADEEEERVEVESSKPVLCSMLTRHNSNLTKMSWDDIMRPFPPLLPASSSSSVVPPLGFHSKEYAPALRTFISRVQQTVVAGLVTGGDDNGRPFALYISPLESSILDDAGDGGGIEGDEVVSDNKSENGGRKTAYVQRKHIGTKRQLAADNGGSINAEAPIKKWRGRPPSSENKSNAMAATSTATVVENGNKGIPQENECQASRDLAEKEAVRQRRSMQAHSRETFVPPNEAADALLASSSTSSSSADSSSSLAKGAFELSSSFMKHGDLAGKLYGPSSTTVSSVSAAVGFGSSLLGSALTTDAEGDGEGTGAKKGKKLHKKKEAALAKKMQKVNEQAAIRKAAQKSVDCKYWLMNGRCKDGDNCGFSHARLPETYTKLCTFLLKPGGCRNGDDCVFSHNPKAVPCRFFVLSTCQKGASCSYGHMAVSESVKASMLAAEEVRKAEENVQKGGVDGKAAVAGVGREPSNPFAVSPVAADTSASTPSSDAAGMQQIGSTLLLASDVFSQTASFQHPQQLTDDFLFSPSPLPAPTSSATAALASSAAAGAAASISSSALLNSLLSKK